MHNQIEETEYESWIEIEHVSEQRDGSNELREHDEYELPDETIVRKHEYASVHVERCE